MAPYIGYDSDTTFIPGTLNTSSSLFIQGGGLTQTGGDVSFDSGTLFIDEDVNRVGIGTTNPSYPLHVDNPYGMVAVSGISAFTNNVQKGFRAETIDLTGNTGNVGVYLSAPYNSGTANAGFFRVKRGTSNIYNGTEIATNTQFRILTSLTEDTSEALRITSTGNVGIGTTAPLDKLHVYVGQARISSRDKTSTGDTLTLSTTESSNRMELLFSHASTNYYRIQAVHQGVAYTALCLQNDGGNVGIGITNPGYKLEVNGSFAATTKSFIIPHPTKEGYKLRHGSLEGPENGVYVRGRSTDPIIHLPDYWMALVDADSITITLTPIGPSGMPRVERIENNKVYIFSEDSRPLDYFYMVNAERVDVAPLEVEIPPTH